ncbi:uncharacterized protein (DUF2345 family), partial [Chitinivorax tropicus]
NVQLSAGRALVQKALQGISLFTHRVGMKLIAASGKLTVQAQDGEAEIGSAKSMYLYSVDDMVRIDAGKGILLTSGGAYIKIANGQIELGAPGDLAFKTARKSFEGPSSVAALTHTLPKSQTSMDERFILRYTDGQPVKNQPYRITKENGEVIEGITDEKGHTQLIEDQLMQELTLTLLPRPDGSTKHPVAATQATNATTSGEQQPSRQQPAPDSISTERISSQPDPSIAPAPDQDEPITV